MEYNVVGWFEIPVSDMERAIKFYEAVFDFSIRKMVMGNLQMGWFPFTETGPGTRGSLVQMPEFYKPSVDGCLLYFTAHSGDLNNELSRVEAAGGEIIQPKKLITEDIGYMALFIDSEGNRIALHSHK